MMPCQIDGVICKGLFKVWSKPDRTQEYLEHRKQWGPLLMLMLCAFFSPGLDNTATHIWIEGIQMTTEKGRSLSTSTARLLVLRSLPVQDKRLLCSLASALRESSWQSNLNHLNPKEQQLTLMRVRSSGPCLPWPLPHSLMGFFFLLFSGH